MEASEQHRPYTEAQRQQIRQAVEDRGDAQLLLFISFIYYCFVRSGGELRLLQIKDLRADTVRRSLICSKNDKGEHVGIPPQLARLIEQHRLRSYPPDYYVFTQNGNPGQKPVGKNFFSRRHRALLAQLGLTSEEYTIYGYKHTGAINLYLATRDIELVRCHCRHHHAGITATYLRKLGVLTALDELSKRCPISNRGWYHLTFHLSHTFIKRGNRHVHQVDSTSAVTGLATPAGLGSRTCWGSGSTRVFRGIVVV